DVFYVSERMEQIRFWFDHASANNATLFYTAGPAVPLQLRHERDAWYLDYGSGLLYVFEFQDGNLVSIRDFASNAITGAWRHDVWKDLGGAVDVVTDSSGTPVYFVYEAFNELTTNQHLKCLSLKKNDCAAPLASFAVNAPKIGPYVLEFDL